jgi:hypothetical protein
MWPAGVGAAPKQIVAGALFWWAAMLVPLQTYCPFMDLLQCQKQRQWQDLVAREVAAGGVFHFQFIGLCA